jgi:hypothetical protein
MSRVCLLDSDEPLKAGLDYTALCGKTMQKAEFVCRWEMGKLTETPMSTIVFCKKCQVKCAEMAPCMDRCYLYGMVAGQEGMDGERVKIWAGESRSTGEEICN